MKTINIAILLSTYIYFTSCIGPLNEIKGSGNIVKIEKDILPFESLSANAVFNVILTHGEKEKLIIEADDNLIETVVIVEKNNKLFLKTQKGLNIKKSKKFNIYVTYRNIKEIDNSCVGNFKTLDAIEAEDLNVKIGGVGNSDIKMDVTNLNASISAVGNTTLSGKTEYTTLKNSGVGNVNAFELRSGELDLNNSGVGNVNAYAKDYISIKNSGIGNVHFKGDAKVKNMNSSGIGSIKKK